MTPRRRDRSERHRITVEARDRESVTPLELFFDLVFVLAITQCSALMDSGDSARTLPEGRIFGLNGIGISERCAGKSQAQRWNRAPLLMRVPQTLRVQFDL